MCGLALNFHSNLSNDNYDSSIRDTEDTLIIEKMMTAISHRGKDQESIQHFDSCTIGFNRLSITDRNIGKNKFNGWTVYMNGEIYNYKNLGFSGTECEVISQGLEMYGPNFVKQLNGMFFIIAVKGSEVYIFRDRYGIKPVYFFKTKTGFAAASEIKALLQHPDYDFDINENARLQWIVFNNILTDETLFKEIYKLDKGSYWHLNTDQVTKYWKWEFTPENMDYKEACGKVRELLKQAVERQTPKEVEYGTCLSGGLDSNIINALSGDIYTFTAGFKGGKDERAVAELSGKKHYQIIYNQIRDFNKTIYHLEDLRVGSSWANYGLYELASKFVKVCFDGAGGDELFAGYNWRYTTEDYYSIVNRTGIKNKYCEELFHHIFRDSLENRYAFDANYFLEGVLLVVDKLSMAHTIEVRLPFLDNDLVDFCTKLPNNFKVNKNILRDSFYDIIPQQVSMNQKQGFSSPDWFLNQKPKKASIEFYNNGNQALRWAVAAYEEWESIFKK